MGSTNSAPLIADLLLFCYERDFMLCLSTDIQLDVINAFNNTSRCIDDTLNLDSPFFARMVSQIYPTELTLIKANHSDIQTPFLDLLLTISDVIISTIMEISILKLSIIPIFRMMYLVPHPMACTSHNLWGPLEPVVMAVISTSVN